MCSMRRTRGLRNSALLSGRRDRDTVRAITHVGPHRAGGHATVDVRDPGSATELATRASEVACGPEAAHQTGNHARRNHALARHHTQAGKVRDAARIDPLGWVLDFGDPLLDRSRSLPCTRGGESAAGARNLRRAFPRESAVKRALPRGPAVASGDVGTAVEELARKNRKNKEKNQRRERTRRRRKKLRLTAAPTPGRVTKPWGAETWLLRSPAPHA